MELQQRPVSSKILPDTDDPNLDRKLDVITAGAFTSPQTAPFDQNL